MSHQTDANSPKSELRKADATEESSHQRQLQSVSAAQVRYLSIEGEPDAIGVTNNHLFWSEDRQDFVTAGALRIGEALRRTDGTVARLVKSVPKRGPPTEVYNLEVDAQHVYHVGRSGILVHNNYEGTERVYALYKDGVPVYFGLSSDVTRRVKEHAKDKVFDYMQELTEPLEHGAARTLEGGLIRDKLETMITGSEGYSGGIAAALEAVGLQNRNRGRVAENWIDSIGSVQQLKDSKLWDYVDFGGGRKFHPDGTIVP
ncbi:MAG: polymorphic toxin-type HINT domain-containing protein [Rhodopirellula sp. JB044]|uniref:polymorphic toxin-type HINT domain-containing protein n=1 Tax=Rhodopirellula sp. JB044 TaxID=3342844 RepID=UPI00370A7CDC